MPESLAFSQQIPEWRRTGHFLLIALALHGLVLLYPLRPSENIIEPLPTVQVRLLEATPPAPVPVIVPPAPVPPAPAEPKKNQAVRPPRPVIALAAKPESVPAPVSVPVVPVPAVVPTPAPSPPASPAPVVVVAARFDAAYLQNPDPNYPAISRRLGEEGKVLLKVRVMPDGRPASVEVEKSSSFPRLDSAARQAVTGWRFVPARRGDEAIEASVIVPVVFRLES